MVKFDQKWPDVEPPFSPAEAHGISKEQYEALPASADKFRMANYFKASECKQCFICKCPTPWVEVNFQGHLCSEECDNQAWKDFRQACREADHRDLTERSW